MEVSTAGADADAGEEEVEDVRAERDAVTDGDEVEEDLAERDDVGLRAADTVVLAEREAVLLPVVEPGGAGTSLPAEVTDDCADDEALED